MLYSKIIHLTYFMQTQVTCDHKINCKNVFIIVKIYTERIISKFNTLERKAPLSWRWWDH